MPLEQNGDILPDAKSQMSESRSLLGAPGESRGYGKIPHGAHGRACDARNPPQRMPLSEQQGGDADVRDRPDAADQCEGEEPAYKPPSGQAAIVVSQPIVEREVSDYCNPGRRCLAELEAQLHGVETQP